MTGRGARDSRVRRLLFVGTNRGPGGTESHLVSLAIAMANAGYEVAAVVRPDDVIARALALDGRIELYEAAFERSYDRRATLDVARACRAVHPDWMIGSFAREFWPLALVARTRRIPLALFLHVQRISRLSAPLFPWLASRFILPSEYLREWVVARRGMPRWRTRVLYNPIDVARFQLRDGGVPAIRASDRAANAEAALGEVEPVAHRAPDAVVGHPTHVRLIDPPAFRIRA